MNQFSTPAEYAANLLRTHHGKAMAAAQHVKETHGMGGQFWRDTLALLEGVAQDDPGAVFALLKAQGGPVDAAAAPVVPARKPESAVPAWVRYSRRPIWWNGKLWN